MNGIVGMIAPHSADPLRNVMMVLSVSTAIALIV
jgi:hypothetical protein